MGSKNKKFSINLPIDVYEKVCESSENKDKTITSTIRQIITQWVETGAKENPKKDQTNDNQALINQLKEHNRTLENLLESANKALDQEQQLHAVSQKTIESQRLQLSEYSKPKTLVARLKAVFSS